jgi:two-component system chemotaxis response regulator CheB
MPNRRSKAQVAIIPRKRRSAGALFARKTSSDVAGDLTDLGCPDCRGVLAVREEGRLRHLAFICSIGHAYSGESLIRSKEEQLEDTLWSAVEVYQEIALLHNELSVRVAADGAKATANAYRRRAKRAAELASDIRRVIANDGAAGAERVKE